MKPNRQSAGSTFASDVLTLATGTVLAQALAVLAAPLLTRLYSPGDFGIYALFLSLTGIVSVIACLRYDLAIMLPDKDGEAVNVLALSLLLAACMSLLLIPLLLVGKDHALAILNASGLEPYLWMVPLSVFLGGAFNALSYWNSRTKQFKRLSVARVASSVASTGSQIGAGLAWHATGGSMICGSISGHSFVCSTT